MNNASNAYYADYRVGVIAENGELFTFTIRAADSECEAKASAARSLRLYYGMDFVAFDFANRIEGKSWVL